MRTSNSRRAALGLAWLWVILQLSSPAFSSDLASVAGESPAERAKLDALGTVEMDPRIASIEIDFEFDPARGSIREQVDLVVESAETRELRLRIDPNLTVERSWTSQGSVEHRKAGQEVVLQLDPPISGRRKVSLTLSGRPRRGSKPLVSDQGVVLSPDDHWYPTLGPTWAVSDVRVKVPEGWVAVAPGAPVAETPDGAFRFRSRKPVRGLALVAGPDLQLTSCRVVREQARIVGPDLGERADEICRHLADPMSWMAGSLSPYPFDGFNLVLLPGLESRIEAGGMVVESDRFPLDGPQDAADLLAGQWFGQRIAGDGPWMRSFAAWQAAVYARDRAKPVGTDIGRLRAAYLAMSPGNDVPLARADEETPEPVLRGKGSAAPDMIRLTVGDRKFFRAVQDLFRMPISPPLSLQGLQGVFEQRAGMSLERAFADWFERRGALEIESVLRTLQTPRGEWRIDLTLSQRGQPYQVPVDVVFHGLEQQHREVISLDERQATLVYFLPFEPKRVEIDPLRRLFRRKPE
ncbi:hypothetical protein ABI59_20885 [Acidobacteria bacterium Mor1]|nr:hypothetical protein ABI59_20885 [Acidobacteria bacterium Mor1]